MKLILVFQMRLPFSLKFSVLQRSLPVRSLIAGPRKSF
jgi:hypothetical protein